MIAGTGQVDIKDAQDTTCVNFAPKIAAVPVCCPGVMLPQLDRMRGPPIGMRFIGDGPGNSSSYVFAPKVEREEEAIGSRKASRPTRSASDGCHDELSSHDPEHPVFAPRRSGLAAPKKIQFARRMRTWAHRVRVASGRWAARERRFAHSASLSRCGASRARLPFMLEHAVPAGRPIGASRGTDGATTQPSEGSGTQAVNVLEVASIEAGIDPDRQGNQTSKLGIPNRRRHAKQPNFGICNRKGAVQCALEVQTN